MRKKFKKLNPENEKNRVIFVSTDETSKNFITLFGSNLTKWALTAIKKHIFQLKIFRENFKKLQIIFLIMISMLKLPNFIKFFKIFYIHNRLSRKI